MFQGVVDREANCSRWHNLHVVQAEPGEECARPLLRYNEAQPLPCRPNLLRRLPWLLLRLQPLHLRR